jgi:hypothetical protein
MRRLKQGLGVVKNAQEDKETEQHNTQLTAFHDARAVVGHIQQEVH